MPTSRIKVKISDISAISPTTWRLTVANGDPESILSIPPGQNLVYEYVATSSVILDPFINTSNFAYSNDNAILNNATETTLSNVYYDIDYSQGITSPVNYQTIISGSATKAPIQDYNWHARRSVIPRYRGSKSTAGSNFNSNTVEGGLGTLPNVEQNRAYFAYFNWVGGTAPEWGNGLQDRSGLSIRYFIDSNGNVIEPTNDSKGISLGLARQIFTEGETAVLSFDDESGTSANFSNLIGEQTIFKSGKTITPIVYSQTASISSTNTGGYTGSLTFVQGDQQENDAIGDYRLTAFADGTQLLYNDNTSIEFGFLQYSGSLVDLWFGDITYSPTGSPSPNEVSASLEFKAKLVPDLDTGDGIDGPAQVTFQWYKNNNPVGNSVQVEWNSSNAVFLSYVDNNVTGSDNFLLKATTVDYSQGGFPALSTNSFFKVIQTPPPGIGAVGPGVGGGDYWQKLGAIGTAGAARFKPNALIPVYNQKQEDISGSGFFGIVNDFTLEVGDEIRFQGTETQAYKIIDVDDLSSPPIFTVDRGITLTNPQMDWFLVRRYVDAPGNIIIEADKPAGGTSPGFFMPLYPTQEIEDNFDNIIKNLKTDQLI